MNFDKLSKGKNFPEEVNVVVEIPAGSSIKYEIDEESGLVTVDRMVYTAMQFPFNYGSVPHTKAGDGDPVDVLVLSSHPVQPGSVLPARPVGVLEMEDESGMDHKIIAVPTEKIDPFFAHIKDVEDIPEPERAKIKHFFEHYKELEPGKWVKVQNFKDRDAALKEISDSVEE
ncbi:MAG: inorganic diphosphatase [Candidatus Spechtbacterales bacterium]